MNQQTNATSWLFNLCVNKKYGELLLALPTATEQELQYKGVDGSGLLHWVSTDKNAPAEVAKALLNTGMLNVNEPNNDNWTALLFACSSPTSAAFVQVLLEFGADPNMYSGAGDTPLCLACRKGGSLEFVTLLLHAGANSEMAYDDLKPIDFATHHNRKDLVLLLSNESLSQPKKSGFLA
jgi:ankyrin repeat protein